MFIAIVCRGKCGMDLFDRESLFGIKVMQLVDIDMLDILSNNCNSSERLCSELITLW